MFANVTTGKFQLPATSSGTQATDGGKPVTSEPAAAANSAAASAPRNGVTPIDPTELEDAVRKLEESVQEVHRSLVFSVDEDSGDPVITVVDKETRQVIRRIPPDEVVSVAERFGNGATNLLKLRA